MSNEQVYPLVAEAFATEINKVWASEETMAAAYVDLLQAVSATTFDRTDHAAVLVQRLFQTAWNKHVTDFKPIAYDITEVLKELCHLLDYSIFTQVYSNLNATVLRYDSAAADAAVKTALEKLPADLLKELEGPKQKYASEEKVTDPILRSHFNTVVAARKMGALNPFNSYRISPIGSTPAFADSSNFSGFSIYLDQFLEANAIDKKVAVLRWTAPEAKDMSELASGVNDGMVIRFPGVAPITSKSGGPILAQTMFARKMMRDLLLWCGFKYQIYPRLFSLTVVFPSNEDAGLQHLNEFFQQALHA